MQGWIFGRFNQAKWVQIKWSGEHLSFQNPLRQNYKHVKAVQGILGVSNEQTHNIVVFAGSGEPRTEMPETVCWGVESLVERIQAERKIMFSECQVKELSKRFASGEFRTTEDTRRVHMEHLGNGGPACPECGADLVLRTARKTGNSFYGCRKFPKCRGTRRIDAVQAL